MLLSLPPSSYVNTEGRWKSQASLNIYPDWGYFRPMELIRTNRLKATELCRRCVTKGTWLLHGNVGHGVPPRIELGWPDGLQAAPSTKRKNVHKACPVGPDHGHSWCCCVSPLPVRSLYSIGCILFSPSHTWCGIRTQQRGCTSPKDQDFCARGYNRMRVTATLHKP